MIRLLVFDLDGTLAQSFSRKVLPGVKEFFDLLLRADCAPRPQLAIATNQGGVGMRHWMESGGFGNPRAYPTAGDIEQRLQHILAELGVDGELRLYISYRYLTPQGEWTPVPEGQEANPRWQSDWRKPRPGMLLQAIADAGAAPHETLFVGDSDDDRQAAAQAGCAFAWAERFFGAAWRECAQLEAWLVDGRL